MEAEISLLYDRFETALRSGVKLSSLRAQFLGKEGELKLLLQKIKDLDPDKRPAAAAAVQALRLRLESHLQILTESTPVDEQVDITLPSLISPVGRYHPISAMLERMTSIFEDLSFEVVDSNELVSVQDNFESLNMEPHHPARDPKDTFYVSEDLLLRTQTTAAQVLEMHKRFQAKELPIRVVVPGRTYRPEADLTHNTTFHQIDAIVVDCATNFTELRGVLDYFARRLLGDRIETRFRVHNFPFTEPSAELDFRLKSASNQGKYTDWLEIGGCGMIHPNVLKRAGINPKIYRGWAFGMAIERPVMMLHEIPDIRVLYQNEPDFLSQF